MTDTYRSKVGIHSSSKQGLFLTGRRSFLVMIIDQPWILLIMSCISVEFELQDGGLFCAAQESSRWS